MKKGFKLGSNKWVIVPMIFFLSFMALSFSVWAFDESEDRKEKHEWTEGDEQYEEYGEKDEHEENDDEKYSEGESKDDGENESKYTSERSQFIESAVINLRYENTIYPMKVKVVGGQILAPAKKLAEIVNAQVNWFEKYEIMEINLDNQQLVVRADRAVGYVNRIKYYLPERSLLFEGDIYVPILFLTKGMQMEVKWADNYKILELKKVK
ncbi:copper amine oxidase N-terminal domain-containing protein [Microaerobacter geothermalis]|uniref:stalk domain-containing protein n=1 Tax=Microaerobacter geothermalis TaxID=674972 RepID=UPI001F1EFD4F|nr:stalk domain-containing protein [Microaerobacter geothermalis]MCF6092492.1 copper amine oxidase N-terminal domain-containing protein [Microaerobacter geothermalis]